MPDFMGCNIDANIGARIIKDIDDESVEVETRM
jgi:hypothetical protein